MRAIGTALAVRWLQFHAFTAGGASSISGWETKIVHAARWGQKKKSKKEKKKEWGGLSQEEGKENNFQEKEELDLFQVSVSCFSLHTTGKPMMCYCSLILSGINMLRFLPPCPFSENSLIELIQSDMIYHIWYTNLKPL